MGLLEIGYHYLILRDGRLVMCRPHDTIGSAARYLNASWIHTALEGGMDNAGPDAKPEANFTPAQGKTLKFLVGYLTGLYDKPLLLKGHSEANPKHRHQCPCVDMKEVRQWVNS